VNLSGPASAGTVRREIPSVFISSTSADLLAFRERIAQLFHDHGAHVCAQRTYPSRLVSGDEIERDILEADVVICLIGYAYGAPLATEGRPPGVPHDYSWTQWEHWLAAGRARGEAPRIFIYDNPQAEVAQSDAERDSQRRFREEIELRATQRFGASFFFKFRTLEELAALIGDYIERPDGALALFRAGTWARLRSAFCASTVAEWQRSFAVHHAEAAASGHDKVPFIATQQFSILVPGTGGAQKRFLHPAGFLPGRDSEAEARARGDATWLPVTRAEVVAALCRPDDVAAELAGVALSRPLRLFLVGGGGVGKTTNMRWLEATINEQAVRANHAQPVFALRVAAGALVGKSDADIVAVLQARIKAETVRTDDAWTDEAIEHGLAAQAAAGLLVILVDGLDHVESRAVHLFTAIQSPAGRWSRCAVVAAGRPQAVQSWEDTPGPVEIVAARAWRFLEPAEFDDEEGRIFLDTADELGRFDKVAELLGGLRKVPRVLEYVRTLSTAELKGVRTSSDIYVRAIPKLIERTLRAGGVQTRMCGPNWREHSLLHDPPPEQVEHLMKLLSALAFTSVCNRVDGHDGTQSAELDTILDKDAKDEVVARIQAADSSQVYDRAALDRDLQALSGFAAMLGNGLVDAGIGAMRTVVWANRTVEQFLAAFWLAVHAPGFDTLADRLSGKAAAYAEEDPQRDTERLRHYCFYPEDVAGSDATYELNLFLAEMPPERISASSWVAAASAWYEPERAPLSGWGARLWPAEMLYRSWWTMHDIAGRPCEDWWDLPYGTLMSLPSLHARAAASWHEERTKRRTSAKVKNLARAVLDRFLGDFSSLLAGAGGSAAQACAREMIDSSQWKSVPAGSFIMGAPLERQGFPSKVRAYWVEQLEAVRSGKCTAAQAARDSTKEEWFTGEQGKRLRKLDVDWLIAQFEPLEAATLRVGAADPEGRADRSGGAGAGAGAWARAMKALEDRWSRHDETPAENPQTVAAFELHCLPVLHRWFWLFAAGHRATVQKYLGTVPHPPDNHPAIYISWFDAWAFCQWANWEEAGVDGPRRYGLRLPHEVEQEYATRWTTGAEGGCVQSPPQHRYWWGDEFYARENEACEEPLSRPTAHAIGRPGATRAPATAAANGLGLHDTLGNVWEWMANLYDPRRERDVLLRGFDAMRYSRALPDQRPPVNVQRTMRGGLWYYLDLLATCTARFRLTCDDRDYKMGFRVVREWRTP
jgi:formylglycine-generating enzyme required for sulfatase activity